MIINMLNELEYRTTELTNLIKHRLNGLEKNDQSLRTYDSIAKDLIFMSSESQERKKRVGLESIQRSNG